MLWPFPQVLERPHSPVQGPGSLQSSFLSFSVAGRGAHSKTLFTTSLEVSVTVDIGVGGG